ncbi:hypothetical protein ACFOWE_14870 [Planomonospora corallina]|uniref:Uncharacterized protein n=1 Tax=Planomonospora corallina TaxID=1806052 RepID=A0ABV8I6H5_9ACTN
MKEREKPLPRLTVATGVISVLLVTSGFVGYFGIENLGEALAFTGRFTGALFVIASAVTALSAVAAVDHWFRRSYEHSGLIVLTGTGIAFMVNFLLMITIIRDGERSLPTICWTALVAGSAWALYAVHRTGIPIPAPGKFGIAALVTTLVAVGDFGYSQLYEPYEQSTHVVLEADFGTPVRHPGIISLPVNVKIANNGEVGVYVLANEYQVLGRKAAVHRKERERENWRSDAADGYPVSRYTEIKYFDLVRKAKFMEVFGEWLNPGEEVNVHHLVEVPTAASYDIAQLQAFALISRKDRMSIEGDLWDPVELSWEDPARRGNESDFIEFRDRIHENNSVAEFTRYPRFLLIRQYVNEGVLPEVAVLREGEDHREMSDEEFNDMVTRYGLISITTGWKETSLRAADR